MHIWQAFMTLGFLGGIAGIFVITHSSDRRNYGRPRDPGLKFERRK